MIHSRIQKPGVIYTFSRFPILLNWKLVVLQAAKSSFSNLLCPELYKEAPKGFGVRFWHFAYVLEGSLFIR